MKKALITLDDTWDDEAIINGFLENDLLPGILAVEIVNHCGKCDKPSSKMKESSPLYDILNRMTGVLYACIHELEAQLKKADPFEAGQELKGLESLKTKEIGETNERN